MYKVGLKDEVITLVSAFELQDLKYWNITLNEIAMDPSPRYGSYSEQLFSFPGVPWRTYNYWITEQSYLSGERVFVFTAEYFDYRPVYVLDEVGQEVEIFAVRAVWTYDPIRRMHSDPLVP